MNTRTKSVQRFIKTMHKEAKDHPGKALGATIADTAIGTLAGVAAAPFLGDYGKYGGLALTLAGHFTGMPMLQTAGIGMWVGGLMAPQTAIPEGDLTDLTHQSQRGQDRFNLSVSKAKQAFLPTPTRAKQQANIQQANMRSEELALEGLGVTPSLQQIEADLVRSALEFQATQAGAGATEEMMQGYPGANQGGMPNEAMFHQTADADFEELTAAM